MPAEVSRASLRLFAQTAVAVADPGRIMAGMIEDFAGHDALITPVPGGVSAMLAAGEITGEAILEARPSGLLMGVRAADAAALADMKGFMAAHLFEHVGDYTLKFAWAGDGAGTKTYPNMHEMTVVRVVDLTPHMRRITFSGDGIERYVGGGPHFLLLVPPDASTQLELPRPGEDGLPLPQSEATRPKARHYTVRRIDTVACTMDVDFVMHEGESVGASWAASARPGAVAGFYGPLGKPVPDADWYLLVGDETALPVIARTLEALPVTARGIALIEVADAREEQFIDCKADIELRWLHRNGAEPGTTSLLIDAVCAVTLPPAGTRIHAMAGVEYAAFKAIRKYWRRELRLDKKAAWPGIYWRRGHSEDEADDHADADE